MASIKNNKKVKEDSTSITSEIVDLKDFKEKKRIQNEALQKIVNKLKSDHDKSNEK